MENSTKAKIVQIEFLDHMSGDADVLSGPAKCVAWGLLVEETKTHYRVISWLCDGEADSADSTGFIILKGPFVRVRQLRC